MAAVRDARLGDDGVWVGGVTAFYDTYGRDFPSDLPKPWTNWRDSAVSVDEVTAKILAWCDANAKAPVVAIANKVADSDLVAQYALNVKDKAAVAEFYRKYPGYPSGAPITTMMSPKSGETRSSKTFLARQRDVASEIHAQVLRYSSPDYHAKMVVKQSNSELWMMPLGSARAAMDHVYPSTHKYTVSDVEIKDEVEQRMAHAKKVDPSLKVDAFMVNRERQRVTKEFRESVVVSKLSILTPLAVKAGHKVDELFDFRAFERVVLGLPEAPRKRYAA